MLARLASRTGLVWFVNEKPYDSRCDDHRPSGVDTAITLSTSMSKRLAGSHALYRIEIVAIGKNLVVECIGQTSLNGGTEEKGWESGRFVVICPSLALGLVLLDKLVLRRAIYSRCAVKLNGDADCIRSLDRKSPM